MTKDRGQLPGHDHAMITNEPGQVQIHDRIEDNGPALDPR
jgi:hypothetical protein